MFAKKTAPTTSKNSKSAAKSKLHKPATDAPAPDSDKPIAEAPAAQENQKAKTKSSVKPEKVSALDAAAKVLAESPVPLTTKQMIEAMAAKGYWTSPGGKTPHSTLYSALLRELASKGDESRFVKTERGKFAAKS